MLARLSPAIADSQETLLTTTTLAPRLLLGELVQLLLLDIRDLARLHIHQRTVPLLQVPLMVEPQLHTSQHQLLVLIVLLLLAPWMVRLLGHMVIIRRLVVL